MRSQKLRLIRLIFLIACLGLAPLAQALTITDIRDVADGHVSSDIKNALYDFSPTIISKGDPDYPSGNVVVIPVETPDFPRNTYVTPNNTCVRLYLFPGLYYELVSGKAFNVKCLASDWATIATKLADYKSASGDPYYASEHPEFMQAVVAAAATAGVNWKQLDANSDGKISRSEATILLLIPVRPDIGWASTTSQTIGKVKTSAGTFDFGTLKVIYLSVTKASLQDSTGYNFLDDTLLTTIMHELLHAFFDLPDRYYNMIPGTGQVGSYCNLSETYQRILLNPHDRMKLGWIRPRILTPDHANVWVKAPTSAATQAALVLLDPARPDEYWLLENRNKSGASVENGLPTEGLAVWWVRGRALPNQSDDVRLVRASAVDQDPDGDGIGDPNHPDWPLNPAKPGYYWYSSTSGTQDLFAAQNGPRILRYSDGTPSKFGLYSISPPGETMHVWIGSKAPPPVPVIPFKPDTSAHGTALGGTGVQPPPHTRPSMPPQPQPQYKTVSPVANPRLELEDGSALVAKSAGRTRYWVRVDVQGRTVTTFDPRTTVVRSSTGDIAVVTEPGGQPRSIGRARATRPRSETRKTRER